MNKTEAVRVAEFAKGCFRFMTDQQGQIIAERCLRNHRLGMDRAIAAIKRHASEHTELDMPNLLLCMENSMREMMSAHHRHTRTVDFIRETNSAIHPMGKSDIAVIVDHYTAAWAKVKALPPGQGRTAGRRMIFRDCMVALAQVGLKPDEQLEIAEMVIEKNAGERIVLDSMELQSAGGGNLLTKA